MRSNWAKLKNAINKMQSELDTVTARVNEAEELIRDLEDMMTEKKKLRWHGKNKLKPKQSN